MNIYLQIITINHKQLQNLMDSIETISTKQWQQLFWSENDISNWFQFILIAFLCWHIAYEREQLRLQLQIKLEYNNSTPRHAIFLNSLRNHSVCLSLLMAHKQFTFMWNLRFTSKITISKRVYTRTLRRI